MSGPKVVLDANVLYGEFVRDLLLSLFFDGIFEAKWTNEITDEWVRNLLENQPDIDREKNRETVIAMHTIRPSPLVENYQRYIEQIDLRDKNDRHVVAAAIASEARKILTWNLRDFPEQVLKGFGIVAESPDKFLADLIIEQPIAVADTFRTMRLRRRKPRMSVDVFIQALSDNRLKMAAKHLARYHDLL